METNSIFSNIKIENGMQVIDIDEDMDIYELLSQMFHKESIVLDNSNVIIPQKNDKRRYFEDTTVCYKCGELGHVSRDCTQEIQKNCMYCDLNHRGKPCDFLFCDNCSRLGHLYKTCKEKRRGDHICLRCPLQYHYSDECPRIWRRYKIVNKNVKANFILSCPLCFGHNHFLDDCELQDRKITIFSKNYLEIIDENIKKSKSGKNKK